MTIRPIRFIVQNPNEEFSASYNCGYPNEKGAFQFALQNARSRGGQILVEHNDSSVEVCWPKWKTAPVSV